MLLTAMSPFAVGLGERLLDADGDSPTEPGSGHVTSLEKDVFPQSGTEAQCASSLLILHLGHTPHFEHRL